VYPNFTFNKKFYLGQKAKTTYRREYRRQDLGSGSGFFSGRIRIRIKMVWIRNTGVQYCELIGLFPCLAWGKIRIILSDFHILLPDAFCGRFEKALILRYGGCKGGYS
jgi:hypothetical protein